VVLEFSHGFNNRRILHEIQLYTEVETARSYAGNLRMRSRTVNSF